MLNKGLRDEENERINNMLKKLIELVFVPDELNPPAIDEQLEKTGLSLEKISDTGSEILNARLKDGGMDWENMEKFADVLAGLSKKPGYSGFKDKAISLYNFIQAESKMFSFTIFNKINALQ